LGIEVKVRQWDSAGSPVAFVLAVNGHRRHLSSSQRACVAVELLPHLEAEAKERQRAGKARGAEDDLPEEVREGPGEKDKHAGEAAQQAAAALGTNAKYVRLARRLKENDAKAFAQVKAGTLTLFAALKPKQPRKAPKLAEGTKEFFSKSRWGRFPKVEKDRLARLRDVALQHLVAEVLGSFQAKTVQEASKLILVTAAAMEGMRERLGLKDAVAGTIGPTSDKPKREKAEPEEAAAA
jgi:hypothetical protein